MIVGKSFKFDAAHKIEGHPKCGQVHGHTWRVDVQLEGKVNSETGMVLDFHELNEIMNEILGKLDHRYINEYLDKPTCEVITAFIYGSLNYHLKGKEIIVNSVKVQEGDGGWAIKGVI